MTPENNPNASQNDRSLSFQPKYVQKSRRGSYSFRMQANSGRYKTGNWNTRLSKTSQNTPEERYPKDVQTQELLSRRTVLATLRKFYGIKRLLNKNCNSRRGALKKKGSNFRITFTECPFKARNKEQHPKNMYKDSEIYTPFPWDKIAFPLCPICNGNDISIPCELIRFLYGFSQCS